MSDRKSGGRWPGRVLWALACAAAIGAARPAAAQEDLPPGPGRDLVYGTCRTCHDLQYLIESEGIPRTAWDDVIDSMREYGLRIPPERKAKILDYLGSYLGPNPPPAATARTAEAGKPDAAELYDENCSACHQPNGKGVADQFPPLAGNHDLFRDRMLPVFALLNGLTGPITVEGKPFNGEMPPVAHLSDAEIAALINHVRSAWGNASIRPKDMAPIDPGTVAHARTTPMTPDAVHTYRAGIR